MRYKLESFEKFKVFQNQVENQLVKKIKAIWSDHGGENLNQEIDDHLKICGILSQWTPLGTPQLNGVSNRTYETLIDMVRCMMSIVELPIFFSGVMHLKQLHSHPTEFYLKWLKTHHIRYGRKKFLHVIFKNLGLWNLCKIFPLG